MNISLTSYGAAQEVTGSNHILNVNGHQVMIDFGMFQGHRKDADYKNRTNLYDCSKIESVLLTHAHNDHCGRLPLLGKMGYKGNIYATPATRDIAALVMADSAHIQQKDAEWLKRKDPKSMISPLYSPADVTEILTRFVTISYYRDFWLAEGIKCQFIDAGHIIGSTVSIMDLGQDRKIAFSGDLGRSGLPIIRDPDPLPPVDYVVCESTYGARLHDPIADACTELADVINETVKRGGKILIPAFAVERTQDLVYFLRELRRTERIPALDIYVDSPMAFNVTSVFRLHQECYDEQSIATYINQNDNPFGFEGLHFVTDVSQSMKLNDLNKPCIIISSSGMCESGRILHHLKNNVEDPKNSIIIVGYMAENTLGRRIVERDPEIRIFGKKYRMKAQVATLNTFSAHADYQEMANYFKKIDLQRLKKVFLVHGENEAQVHLSEVLLGIGVKSVEIVKQGIPYPLFS